MKFSDELLLKLIKSFNNMVSSRIQELEASYSLLDGKQQNDLFHAKSIYFENVSPVLPCLNELEFKRLYQIFMFLRIITAYLY